MLQYADFAAWERRWLQDQTLSRLTRYWRRQLGGAFAPLRMVVDRPRLAAESIRGARVAFQLPYQLSQRIAGYAQSRQASHFMVLSSALRILLYRYTRQSDFLIGTTAIRRNLPGTGQLIGYFGNTLPLRNALAAADCFDDVLARERDAALGAYENQELPFELLGEEIAREYPARGAPQLQVMLTFAEATLALPATPGFHAEVQEVETGTAKFELLVSMRESDAGLGGVFEYAADLFDRETIERMAGISNWCWRR